MNANKTRPVLPFVFNRMFTISLICLSLELPIFKRFILFVVPGPIPAKSVKGTPFEDKIFLNWKEPVDPNGIITQYEVIIKQLTGIGEG